MDIKPALKNRTRILDFLIEKQDTFISGHEMSEWLSLSRTAIWKHIEALRAEGYVIESQKKSGYRLMKKPDLLSAEEILAGLHTKRFAHSVHYEETMSSTQEIANMLAHNGAEEGTFVVTDEQTNGKGRLGRSWHSPKGLAISASLVLRPEIPPREAPQLTLLAAVSIVKGIKQATGLDCDIKWPNDILYRKKKLVGILTELQTGPDQVNAVLLGMGLNVNTSDSDFPSELRRKATSLRMEIGEKVNRAHLLQHILQEFEKLYDDYLQEGFRFVKLLWESYALGMGKIVQAQTLRGWLVGRAKEINDDGFLLLEDEKGEIHQVSSADIDLSYDE